MQGTFVVRIGAHHVEDGEVLEGRVEEVDSGRSLRFQSGEELLQFLQKRQREAVAEHSKEQ